MGEQMMNPVDFVRPEIFEMEPYTPIFPFEVLAARLGRKPEEIIKLDANENPYGPSPKVTAALKALPYINIYPDPESRLLRQALADFVKVPVENLLAGAGADELLDLIMRLFLAPGDRILNCPPTFGMYPFDAAISGAGVVSVERRPDFSLDIDAIEASVKKTGRCLVIHEATRTSGFGAELAALVQERCFYHLEAPVERVTGFDTPYPHSLEWAYFPGPVRIATALTKILTD